MGEIERILRSKGRSRLSIGSFLRVSPDAHQLMEELSFFTEHGCATYLPIDINTLFNAALRLRIKTTSGVEKFPDFSLYREKEWLNNPNLAVQAYRNYPELFTSPSFVRFCFTR